MGTLKHQIDQRSIDKLDVDQCPEVGVEYPDISYVCFPGYPREAKVQHRQRSTVNNRLESEGAVELVMS